ncbi:cell surface protein SprA [Pontibacter sp. G13]|uniref:T9SS outer membrane translocon Sov/SprA n=1 Tax=Pontibacter sp. G13 TaxID=3074898 RepID=UPI00288B0034|nr:cell surface protein SprA [Pontibacter sp. G13]WNJ21415.1 cell surface protein SprA [Pontibacter sp. G13]
MSKFSFALLFSAIAAFFAPENEIPSQDPSDVKIGNLVTWSSDPDSTSLETDGDTSKVKKNPNDRVGDATQQEYVTPLQLPAPGNFQTSFELDTDSMGFNIFERAGALDIRRPSYIGYEDYISYRLDRDREDYFREKSLANNEIAEKGLELNIDLEDLSDIFRGGTVSIRPTGFATLKFSLDHNFTDNPSLPERQRSITTFNFDQQIQLGVIGQIGEALKINANFDNQANFAFENQLKLEHSGTEDDILQNIEVGQVSMQVGNSLIQGRQNLDGIKTRLRFGPVYVTALASMERGRVESVNVGGGGAIETPFEKGAAEYDQYRHYFLSHYFRSRYEDAMSDLPIIRSNLRINRVEVWVEQQGVTQNNRNALGLVDLGENDTPFAGGEGVVYNDNLIRSGDTLLPSNNANNLYSLLLNDPAARQQNSAKSAVEGFGIGATNTEDFQVIGNMRRLRPEEYTVNTQLGYISLNSPVRSDQVLFVAFNYSLNGQNLQVGEFSDDVPADGLNSNVLFLKMLKPNVLRVSPYPAWDLMMKNIYNIGYGLQGDGFYLDVKFDSRTSAGKINFLPDGPVDNIPLIQVLGLDRLTNNTSPGPDNYFDYLEGLTVRSDKGLVIFPVLEPFGEFLAEQLDNDPNLTTKYVFQPLYDDTQPGATNNFPELNSYSLQGTYRSSSSSEIPLNTFNLQEGSVTVTAGGRTLTEGQDYQVDYFGGKVTIINQAILTSGQDIQVNYESASLVNTQTKILLGARAEYSPSDKIALGATVMNLKEQPFNIKTILGDEPLNNTLWGLDGTYQSESDFMTRLIDKIPLVSTTSPSSISLAGEFAQFLPGTPSVNKTEEDRGIVYLDDFEAAAQPTTITGIARWKMASFPEGNPRLFDPRTAYLNPLRDNYTRAKLSWYQIDQTFYLRGDLPIPDDDKSNNYTRQIQVNEIFPTANRAFGNTLINTFDLHYIPNERGLHNYQTSPTKLNPQGNFVDPEENWAGVQREIDVNNDFEATNVEFLEFWMMDPFMDEPDHEGGEFYINLGLVGEDVLPDETLSRESGLPGVDDEDNTTETDWGRVPQGNNPNDFFLADADDRIAQDVGLDGLDNEGERTFFAAYLDSLRTFLAPDAMAFAEEDPSSDDFYSYRDPRYQTEEAGILERYALYNGMERNSPPSAGGQEFTLQSTTIPDNEDLNGNGSVDFAEQYWEYRMKLHPDSLEPGTNFIVDKITTEDIPTGNANVRQTATWIQFRVPLNAGRSVGGINNFKAIGYMRMYMNGWQDSAILRLAEFQLVATQWRKYAGDLSDESIVTDPQEPPFTSFELGSVSIEENSAKEPFNYILPPGVERLIQNGSIQGSFLQNERSLQIKTCNLKDGDARGIFKKVSSDLRQYDRLKMWVHAEPTDDGVVPPNFVNTGDATAFIRLGMDNDENYYEYELPLTPSTPNDQTAENIWLASNEFDFELVKLALAKEDRNNSGTGLIYRHAYRDDDLPEGHQIYVKGTPQLSDVRNIVIGVRNPTGGEVDPVCLEVWVNELRMTNFNASAGWAGNASARLKLADLGSIDANVAYKSTGFGPLEQRLSTRSLEEMIRYNISASLNLDKFFPKKWGLQLPMYATFGEQIRNPLFDPQEGDVSADRLVESLDPEDAKERLREIQDYRRTRSINFNDWRKIKVAPGPRAGGGREGGRNQQVSYPWDISNFSVNYAYSESYARSATIEQLLNTQHQGGMNYRYTFPQLSVKPFSWVKKSSFLSQWSFNPLPTSFSMTVNGNRLFEDRRIRPTTEFGGDLDPLFTKNFLITRSYNLTWAFTQNLQLNYSATNISRVDEVKGYWSDATQEERDSVGSLIENLFHVGRDTSRGFENLINMGRNIDFVQNINLAYQLPFSQIKPLNWISGNVGYSASFNWQQAPEINPSFGGSARNNQNIQASARLDLNGLYRKFKPLRDVLDAQQKRERERRAAENASRNPRRPNPQQPQPTEEEADTTKQPSPFVKFLKNVGREVVRIGLSVKSADLSYTGNNSTTLPGYLPRTNNFGFDWEYVDPATGEISSVIAPTWQFIFGGQRDIRPTAAQYGWISRDSALSNLFLQNSSEQLTGRTSVELFRGFRVELNVNRSISTNDSEFFRWDPQEMNYRSFDPLRSGNFTMSTMLIGTAWEFGKAENSESYNEFDRIRQDISRRYSEENPNTVGNPIVQGGYVNGYLGSNQDVLITSMLASYGVYNPNKIKLTSFPDIPLPNWSVNYNLLTGIPSLKKWLSSMTLKHAYRATYSVGTFNNNLNFLDDNGDGFADEPKIVGIDSTTGTVIVDYFSEDNIQAVQMSEQFAPLIGFNMNWKNGVTTQIDFKKGRQLTMNVGSLQLVELRNTDVLLMVGYRKDKLNWNLRLFGRELYLRNSMNFSLRATLRETREVNHVLPQIVGEPRLASQPTRGSFNLILNPTVDYVVNKRLNVRVFFEYNFNDPVTGNAYRTAFTSGGFQLRFALSN